MRHMTNCFWAGQCEYEQTTSYGTELVRCMNTDCILWEEETISEENENESGE